MTSIADRVPHAASYLTVANTPIFLVNKLRRDSQMAVLANKLSSTELVTNIARCLKRPPSNVYEEVEPYVYLVALAMKGDIRFLKEFTQVSDENYRWFAYLADYLFRTTTATLTTTNPVVSVPANALVYVAPKYTTPTTTSIRKDAGR